MNGNLWGILRHVVILDCTHRWRTASGGQDCAPEHIAAARVMGHKSSRGTWRPVLGIRAGDAGPIGIYVTVR